MKDLFQKWFDNVTVYTFELNQKGALGAEAHTAIWMGNSFKDTELSAYMYDITSNSYYPINCIVDSVGYIHVTYNAGGTLVFTTSPPCLTPSISPADRVVSLRPGPFYVVANYILSGSA